MSIAQNILNDGSATIFSCNSFMINTFYDLLHKYYTSFYIEFFVCDDLMVFAIYYIKYYMYVLHEQPHNVSIMDSPWVWNNEWMY